MGIIEFALGSINILIPVAVVALLLYLSINIIRPTQRGLIERVGKYNRYATPGIHFLIPFVERMARVNVTEQMVDAEEQTIITKDNLNASVDAQVYFRVRADERSVKSSQYNVDDFTKQIVALSRTTLRNIIGNLTLTKANRDRNAINKKLLEELMKEVSGSDDGSDVGWGIDVVRTELKEIEPPSDVQKTMNDVVKAENVKTAANDYANAEEKKADGFKRADIKRAGGRAQSVRIEAKAEAERIKLVNEAANKYFIDNAQKLRKYEVVQKSLENNTKIILTEKGIQPILVVGDEREEKKGKTKIIPIIRKVEKKKGKR